MPIQWILRLRPTNPTGRHELYPLCAISKLTPPLGTTNGAVGLGNRYNHGQRVSDDNLGPNPASGDIRQGGSAHRPQGGPSHFPTAHELSMDPGDMRKANYVHQQFSGRKFKGNLSQSVEFLLRDYEACAHQHRLTPAQKAEYFMNVLEGPARTYLLNKYAQGMAYEHVVQLMRREYDSDSRQLQVQSTLECLNLDTFMSTRSLNTHSDGLTKLV